MQAAKWEKDEEEKEVSSPPLGLIEHDGRLDILCCFEGDEPLTPTALSARTGGSPLATSYHLESLLSHGVVRRTGEQQDGESRYESRLGDQPEWVQTAVAAHRRGEKRGPQP
jgi:DNA-binding transcriptional ArsR family regulator